MQDPRSGTPGVDDTVVSTDDVLSESVERVRSSRQLLAEIDQRLRRGQRLLSDQPVVDLRDDGSPT